jgi:HSP20 family molecular chaperone IbpA
LDIAEDSGRFVLYADLPGLAQEAINPAYTNGVLVITLPKGEPEDLS